MLLVYLCLQSIEKMGLYLHNCCCEERLGEEETAWYAPAEVDAGKVIILTPYLLIHTTGDERFLADDVELCRSLGKVYKVGFPAK